ncbi:hypothetical protein D9O50_13875 [Oxalobacteraceae bacterium CAVE-383]|nr:hypothetical protein D9O50_13875 [Oxalobacteraceae bacterium CAVE-383]
MTIASAAPKSNHQPASLPGQLPASLPVRHPRRLQAEWHDCRQAAEGLRHADTLKTLCLRLCEELQLKVAGNAFFQFSPGGVAGTVLLGDARIALHTWPEHNMLKADIHLLQNGSESSALAFMERLKVCFQPVFSSMDQCRRLKKLN